MSAPIRSILVALDDSKVAPLVFDTGAALARQMGAEVSLLRVLVLPPEIPPAAHAEPDHLLDKVQADTRADLRALSALAPDVAFRPPLAVPGDPWRQIIEVSDQLNVDLIVIGSHRYHGLDRVLGTTAARVVNHAHRNVLVVHDRPAATPKGTV